MAQADRTLMLLAIVAVGIAAASLGMNMTGNATDTGEVNFTIVSSAQINFTTASIDWASGKVDTSKTKAYLDTLTGTVLDGNWSFVSQGLVLENIGSNNVSLDMQVGKSAAAFISGTGPSYNWAFSDTEAGACTLNTTNIAAFATMYTTSTTATRVCDVFQFLDTKDVITIDFNLTVPYDATQGSKTDTVTATATVI